MRSFTKLYRLCLLGFLALASQSSAQPPPQKLSVVQLKQLLETALPDSTRVDTWLELSKALPAKDSLEAITYAQKAADLAAKRKWISRQVTALMQHGFIYLDNERYRKSLPIFRQAEALALASNDYAALGKIYSNLGNIQSELSETEAAFSSYRKSLFYEQRIGNKKGAAITYNNLGSLYVDKGNLDSALLQFQRGVALREAIGDELGIARTKANMSVVYKDLNDLDRALQYGDDASTIYKRLNASTPLAILAINLGLVAYRKQEYTLAQNYYDTAIKVFTAIGYKKGLLTAYSNKALAQNRKGNTTEAIASYKQAEALSRTTQNEQGIVTVNINLADIYVNDVINYPEAATRLQEAETLANKIGYSSLKRDVYNGWFQYYKTVKNFDEALRYNALYLEMKDSILNEERVKNTQLLSTKFETEKKELQLALLSKQDSVKAFKILEQSLAIANKELLLADQAIDLAAASNAHVQDSLALLAKEQKLALNTVLANQQVSKIALLQGQQKIQALALKNKNTLLVSAGILLFLLAAFAVVYIRNYQLKQQRITQQKLQQQQQQATEAIITAEEQERKRIAGDLHDGIGQTMMAAWLNLQAAQTATIDAKEHLVQKAMHLVQESCKDVRAVSHNMMPNALLKQGLVNAVKEFTTQIDATVITVNVHSEGLQKPLPSITETVLYRVIQETVNNVIKHAKATLLDITILHETDGIDVLVEDNGIGFLYKEKVNSNTAGLGLQNIQNRVAYLKGTVEWSSATDKGTVVAIHIPLNA